MPRKMNAPIIHYVKQIPFGDYFSVRAICQIPRPRHVTTDKAKATCKRCLRVLGSVGEKAEE